MTRSELRTSAIRWISLTEPSEAELTRLGEEFHFHPLDIADCKRQGQRPKVERYSEYAFLVFLLPMYNRETREIEPGEVDFFVGPDYLITIRKTFVPSLNAFWHQCEEHAQVREQYGQSSVALLQEILDRFIVSLYPMLDHISLDIHEAERQIFNTREKKLIAEIGLLRRNITDYRRIVQQHKNTLKRLIEILRLNHLKGSGEALSAFERTIDRTKEIWDLLESYRESVDTVYETNESLISYKLNDIMRTFTTMSVMIFLMTLVATLFAARARGTPLLEAPFAFWILVLFVVGTGFGARQFFKRRRLLE